MNCKNWGCVGLKKYKSQGKAAEVTVNSKEELLRLLSGLIPRIRPRFAMYTLYTETSNLRTLKVIPRNLNGNEIVRS
jgi:hypothetical protein